MRTPSSVVVVATNRHRPGPGPGHESYSRSGAVHLEATLRARLLGVLSQGLTLAHGRRQKKEICIIVIWMTSPPRCGGPERWTSPIWTCLCVLNLLAEIVRASIAGRLLLSRMNEMWKIQFMKVRPRLHRSPVFSLIIYCRGSSLTCAAYISNV